MVWCLIKHNENFVCTVLCLWDKKDDLPVLHSTTPLYYLLHPIYSTFARCPFFYPCVARMGEMRNAYKILVGKPEGKRPLGRSRHRWEGNIRMDLREVMWEGVDWMYLAQNMDQWRNEPLGSIKD